MKKILIFLGIIKMDLKNDSWVDSYTIENRDISEKDPAYVHIETNYYEF